MKRCITILLFLLAVAGLRAQTPDISNCRMVKVMALLNEVDNKKYDDVDNPVILNFTLCYGAKSSGYASDDSENYMPLPIVMAHKLVRVASSLRHEGKFKHARPDMKSQVTIEYIDGKPNKIDTIVVSTQHSDEISIEELRQDVYDEVIMPVLYNYPDMVSALAADKTERQPQADMPLIILSELQILEGVLS